MQRMKIYAASVGFENGGSKQMIEIDQHGCDENEIDLFPVFLEENERNEQWKSKVQKIVYECFHYCAIASDVEIILK